MKEKEKLDLLHFYCYTKITDNQKYDKEFLIQM